jgi:hypothetical protein
MEANGTPHAIIRAKERLGIEVSVGTLHNWTHDIKFGRATYIKTYTRSGPHLSVYEVKLRRRPVFVVFDATARDGLGKVVTVLTDFVPPNKPEAATKDAWRRLRARRAKFRWSKERWCS